MYFKSYWYYSLQEKRISNMHVYSCTSCEDAVKPLGHNIRPGKCSDYQGPSVKGSIKIILLVKKGG